MKAKLSAVGQESLIDIRALASLLAPYAQSEPLGRLTARPDAEGFARIDELPSDEIRVRFEPGDLSLAVELPPRHRKMGRIDLLGRSEAARGYIVVPPARASAYVNMRAAVEYLTMPDPTRPDGIANGSVVFEGALNLRGWVLEAEGYYKQDSYRRWSRGPIRVVRDSTEEALRFQAGDLRYPTSSTQVGRSLGGFAVSRDYGLQPYRSVQPSGQRDFILEQPSLVEVFVNGRPMRSFRLDAGPYNLSNFPGTSGTNDVRIRITDSFGREQVVDFPFFFDTQLLARGLHDFSYAVGYPIQVNKDRYSYDTNRPTVSAYHRYGVDDQLTLGTSLQADDRQQVVGLEGLLATPIGTFALEPLASFGGSTGYGVNLRYRDFRSGESIWNRRTVTAQVAWRDSALASFGVLDPNNATAVDAALRISQPLLDELTATLGARWRHTRVAGQRDGYAVDLSLRQRLGTNGSLDLTLSHDRPEVGDIETGAYVSFRYNFDEARQTAGLSVDTIGRERRLDWRYQSLQPIDQWAFSTDITNRAGGDRYSASAGYAHQRFLAGLRTDVVERELSVGSRGIESRTQLNVGTALAFADGHVAVTRPITNSFAIVVPHPRIETNAIGVDPVAGTYIAKSDGLGPAVVPDISAYLVRPILIDVDKVPPGYDLGADRPAIQPGYRTGTIVPIGSDVTAALDGVLLAADGTAIGLQSGVLRPVGGPARQELTFFTNRKGRFRLEGVRAGAWQLVMNNVEARPIDIEVPAGSEGVRPLGEIRLVPP